MVWYNITAYNIKVKFVLRNNKEKVICNNKNDEGEMQMKRSKNLERAIVLGLILSTGVCGSALAKDIEFYGKVDTDGNTIRAVTFYSHGETAGLGGEIDNPRWQALWVDKKIENADGAYSFVIKKNADHEGVGKDFEVDSLSGATLTSRGVDNAVRYWLGDAYKPFLDNVRKGEIIK